MRDATSGEWRFEQQLVASDPEDDAGFGGSVAVDGNVLVIGSPSKDNGSFQAAGAAYVFRHDPSSGTWSEEQKLVPSLVGDDEFGISVAIAADIVVVGAAAFSGGPGSAWVFRYDTSTSSWSEEQQLLDPDGASGDLLRRARRRRELRWLRRGLPVRSGGADAPGGAFRSGTRSARRRRRAPRRSRRTVPDRDRVDRRDAGLHSRDPRRLRLDSRSSSRRAGAEPETGDPARSACVEGEQHRTRRLLELANIDV